LNSAPSPPSGEREGRDDRMTERQHCPAQEHGKMTKELSWTTDKVRCDAVVPARHEVREGRRTMRERRGTRRRTRRA